MGESRVRTSSLSWLHKEETVLVTVPPAPANKLPTIVGGEDKDLIARQRRDKVKEVSLILNTHFCMFAYKRTTVKRKDLLIAKMGNENTLRALCFRMKCIF